MAVMLSVEPLLRASVHKALRTWPSSCVRPNSLEMNRMTSSLVNESGSKMPSHAAKNQSPDCNSVVVMSGLAITCSSVGPASFFFLLSLTLYGLSPIALDIANSPLTRSFSTWPPARLIRASSMGRDGEWSCVMAFATPFVPMTIRESPTLATWRQNLPPFGTTMPTTAVLPLVSVSGFFSRNSLSICKVNSSNCVLLIGSLTLATFSPNMDEQSFAHKLPE
mmetsp:Transcript_996/g.2075  ORF Transcript_996/g.2075 Transcript_996/m.2075 type:complete len:222 (+) Transcript_996:944-1609(+)